MECADDIAYAVHDLEDIVARNLVSRSNLAEQLNDIFPQAHVGPQGKGVNRDDFLKNLFDHGSHCRKQFIGHLVNLFVTEAKIQFNSGFEHPLLRLRVGFYDSGVKHLLEKLKTATYDLVIKRAPVQQLERRGKRVVEALYGELLLNPDGLIPTPA